MTLYMPLFRACRTSRTLFQLHAHLIVTGLQRNPLASTKLIESYSQMGYIKSSKLIFDNFLNPDSFMWGVLIKCCVWNGLFQEAIFMYQNIVYNMIQFNSFILPSILRACSAINDLGMGKKVHCRIIKSGIESDPFVETSLLSMYGEIGCLYNARKIFDEMSVRDMVSWSSIISIYVRNGEASEGLKIFRKMTTEGMEIDSVTMFSISEACGELRLWRAGKSVHGYVVRRNNENYHGALGSSLVAMYGKFGDLRSAELLFYGRICESMSLWTAIISCYNQNGCFEEAVATFIEMQESNVDMNTVTLMNVVSSCARLGWLREGKSIHGYVIRNNIDLDRDFLRSQLIDMYANCGKLNYAHEVFDMTKDRHIVSWNILISGYVREQMTNEAFTLFVQMFIKGILPDSFALASVLSACGDTGFSKFGCQVHGCAIKTCLLNEFVQNALIDMYSKCGYVDSAYRVFLAAQQESVVAWNSMMCGFSQNGYSEEAISLFDEIYAKCLEVDEVTFLSAIQACSNLGYIEKGKWIHNKLITFGVTQDMYMDTALSDMYARCGDLQTAQRVFNSMTERSTVSWSVMIAGYGMHGHIDAATSLFNKMVTSGIRPNDVIFMNILSACSHAGYVEEGKFYFNSMIKDFDVKPNSEHYACLVDMLSRAGYLNGAYEVINSMPFPADASIWGALVNGCRIHQRMDFLKSIQGDLVNKDTNDSGYYTLLSNVYAGGGEWNEFRTVRSKIRSIGLKKVHGYSLIEVDKTS
ncbi:putative pentatricopeptide repeat-containing protein At1g69350, mitochondrial [Olea europaea var. sylvestris]|uniref:putative pentatricopeptide repeat-containing protein At1g69350, mitochondrial n=1 Tax=Olea europaea var. sylvestris TaxID=158386 RepID=UPI000C1CD36E|nr:putative pentatricopeptide repeat-containing protein At1g69350, mitochondrial [Olea europaea var. sylvestris]